MRVNVTAIRCQNVIKEQVTNYPALSCVLYSCILGSPDLLVMPYSPVRKVWKMKLRTSGSSASILYVHAHNKRGAP